MGEPVHLRSLWVLMVTAFVDMLGYWLILALLPFYAEHFNATPLLIGCLVSAFALAQMLTAPLWGRVSDRWGRRPVILIGLTVSALAYVLFAVADSLWLLLLSRLVQGTGAGTVSAVLAYVSDAVAPEERAQGLGWLTAATSAAAMIGPALGSLSSQLDPDAPGFMAAGLCVLNVYFAWRWLSPPSKRPETTAERSASRGSIRRTVIEVIRRPYAPISSLIWVYYFAMMAFTALMGVVALYLERTFSVSEDSIWIYFFYVGAISVLMRILILGPAVRRLGEVKVLRIGALCMGIGMAAIPLSTGLPMLALCVLLVPVGTSLLFPCTTSLVSRNAKASHLGQILGVQQSFGAVSKIVGPIWAGAAFQHLRVEAPFWIGGVTVLVVAALTARLSEPRQPLEEISPVEPTATESL